ncbi:hypothetical protein HPB52_003510 [Rhipicephalus sanguineus]|uniref:Uncharacterized protein n=1 Tax=Rhipicephalus sanguineus TaxID=34632 RepID=A0A9D4T8M2_RHISA|nr:hypothetical protein HPB52_003510 [Rhipicephalus sanguineus]
MLSSAFTCDSCDPLQGDAAVTVHRSPRWYFSGRLKPRSRNRGAIKPASMAAAALRKLFRGERHRLSTGANHNEPKKKKESAEGGSRLLSLCAGKASSERGQGKAARKPAEGASPRAPGSPTAAGGGGDTTADAAAVAVPSSRSTRSPRNRVAPCSQQAAVRARRLMRELQEIRRQQTRGQQPSFTVDLVEDNLYEWHVRLYQVDPESPLWRDMQESGVSCVQLSVSFPENFPFAPPFVRVLAPHIERGFVMEGGAICMELLTPRGWASAYTVEAILVQVDDDGCYSDIANEKLFAISFFFFWSSDPWPLISARRLKMRKEGQAGSEKQGLGFQKICHSVTIIDCQPMFDGGILISVLGQLKTDDDPAHTFNQVFVLKPIGDSFYVEHDVFRLALHHTA